MYVLSCFHHCYYHSTITEVLDQSKTFTPNCKTGLFVSVWTFTRKLASLSPAAVRVITIDIGSAEHVNIYFRILLLHWKQAELWQCHIEKFFLNFSDNFHKYPLLLEQTWIMAVINFISFPNYGSGGNYLLIKQKEKKSSTKENLCGVLKNGRVGPSIYKDEGRGIFLHARVHEFGGFKVMARCRSQ